MDDSQSKKYIKTLNEFVVNCQDLQKPDQFVGKFNIFRVLRFEYGELRHSNMLAWLFDPTQSHGLGDLFLRRWLMRILLESKVDSNTLNPVDVDSGGFVSVDVYRESWHIDLVILIKTLQKESWVIAIENKVLSTQGEGQLARYREQNVARIASGSS